MAKNEAGSHDDPSGDEGQVKLRGGPKFVVDEATVDGGAGPVPWFRIFRQKYDQAWGAEFECTEKPVSY